MLVQTSDLVHMLDGKTLDSFIESNDVVVLSVVMLPYLESCRNFVPQFQLIVEQMQDSNIKFAQINVIGDGDALVEYGINSFPRIMLFQGMNNYKMYRGVLKPANITAYLRRFLYFPVLSTVTAASLSEFKKISDVVVIGFLQPGPGSADEQFKALSSMMHPEFVFGITDDPELAKHEGIQIPGVMVCKNLDEEVMFLDLTECEITLAVDKLRIAARPLVAELTTETQSSLLDLGVPVAYVFVNLPQGWAEIQNDIEMLARAHRETIQFSIANPLEVPGIAKDLHLDLYQLPAFAIREAKQNFRYPMKPSNGPFLDAINQFVLDYQNGKLTPTIKSEPLPTPPQGDLVKVVGLNIQEIVMDKNKDVLLVYCIEKCGPCHTFMPTLLQLASLFALREELKDKVTVAKVMFDANDVPERGIQAFPTIKLYFAGAKDKPVRFFGARTLEALVEHVHQYGTHKGNLRGLAHVETRN